VKTSPVAALLSFVLIAGGACTAREEPPASDSLRTTTFRTEADSLAAEMARELATTGTRSGSWRSGDTSSTWTARMQREQPVVIEEHVRIGDRESAVRAFFFDPAGALEQVSERHTRVAQSPSNTPARVTETVIDFTSGTPTSSRTVDGRTTEVPLAAIERLRAHADTLAAASRRAPPDSAGQ
jgi:hypothetical protein